ncbi:hypothetical protein DW933_06525 [Lachnospira eligens]|uniref:Uncharacterized protein n=1 Tax=Lachnospira eligens TaxID=39485 RepID=A0A415MBA5_9FIRM|nr:hypothetical protein DW933_06525 [Lachnospira eligens]RHL68592.1 hypothetical protein DW007_07185 [Lachnospira eligens]
MGQYRVYTFGLSSLSSSKCRHLQSLLQYGKSNALRLNEIFRTALLQIAVLTYAQHVRLKYMFRTDSTAESVYLMGSLAGSMWQLPFKGWCADAPGRCTAGAVIGVCCGALFIWDSVK